MCQQFDNTTQRELKASYFAIVLSFFSPGPLNFQPTRRTIAKSISDVESKIPVEDMALKHFADSSPDFTGGRKSQKYGFDF